MLNVYEVPDPAIPFSAIYPREMRAYIHIKTSHIFIFNS